MANLAKPNAEFGKGLVNAAREQYDEDRKKRVIERVTQIMRYIDESAAIVQKHGEAQSMWKAQIKALERGEFKIDPNGLIVFDDTDLRRERAFT